MAGGADGPVAGVVRRLRHRPVRSSSTWRLARGLAAGAVLLGVVVALLTLTVIKDSGEFPSGVPVGWFPWQWNLIGRQS